MSILAANLKHLYQRRGLWLIYIFLGFIAFMLIMAAMDNPGAGKGRFVWFVLLAFLIGSTIAGLSVETLTKPFSYCLPNHRKTVRKFLLLIGVVVCFLGSLLFLAYPGLYGLEWIIVLCSAFFVNLIFYWLGVAFTFVKNLVALIGLLPLILIVGMFFDLHILLENAIVQYPLAVVCVGILSSIMAWMWLGSEGLARRYCAVPWIGIFDIWNKDKLKRYSQARQAMKWDKRLKNHPSPGIERFFLTRIQQYNYLSLGRYIWGGLYTTFAIGLSGWKSAVSGLLMALLMICGLGYMGSMASTFMLFIMPGFMVAQARLPVYSSMVISGGRRERFFTALTLVVVSAVLITAMVTTIAALAVPLAEVMPDITLRGSTFTFYGISLKLFFIPLLMIPIVFTIQLIFLKKPFYTMVIIMFLFVFLFSAGRFLKTLNAMVNPVFLVISLLVLSWVIFVAVLRYICMKRSLVGQ